MRSRLPKVLHPVCGRTMLSLVVETAKAAGSSPIVVVVPPESPEIRQSLDDGVLCVEQPHPLGSGDAVLQAQGVVEDADTIAVLYGDVPLIRPETVGEMVRAHEAAGAGVTLLTARVPDPDGLGRIVRNGSGEITSVVEESDADPATRAITEVSCGAYCFSGLWLRDNVGTLRPSSGGELYLTGLVSRAATQRVPVASVQADEPRDTLGVNTRLQLADAEAVLRERVLQRWMLEGVTIADPASVYIDVDVRLGQDSVVLPNTHVNGRSVIGRDCEIGPNTIIRDCVVGDGCRVVASVLEGSTLEDGVEAGPFSHVRPGSHLESGVRLGNYTEVKNSRLGRDTRSGHFSFVGDADVGANVNIGAGTITCNYDGHDKHRTVIGDGAFIGSDTMLVAPVTIGQRATTGAGAVVTRDVPADSLAKGVPAKTRPKKPEDTASPPVES